eukprot:8458498-Karenia_brevis.AAC.1
MNRSIGPDVTYNDLCKVAAPSVVRHLMPIYFKTATCCCEPLLWKGGLAADVRKSRDNDPAEVKSFRSILYTMWWKPTERNRFRNPNNPSIP